MDLLFKVLGIESVLGKPIMQRCSEGSKEIASRAIGEIRVGSNPTLCTMLFIQRLNKPDGPKKIEALKAKSPKSAHNLSLQL